MFCFFPDLAFINYAPTSLLSFVDIHKHTNSRMFVCTVTLSERSVFAEAGPLLIIEIFQRDLFCSFFEIVVIFVFSLPKNFKNFKEKEAAAATKSDGRFSLHFATGLKLVCRNW